MLKARLRAGLRRQLSPVPPPALAARTRGGAGLAVPVEDGFAFAAPKRVKKKKTQTQKKHPGVLVRSEQRLNFSHQTSPGDASSSRFPLSAERRAPVPAPFGP